MSLFLVYMSFSVLEGLAIFYLMFSFFGIVSFKENVGKISLIAASISLIMYTIHNYNFMENYSSFLNLVLLFLTMAFVFKIGYIKSLYVSVVSLLFVLCLQILLVGFTQQTLRVMEMDVATTGILQLIEIIAILILSFGIKKFRSDKIKEKDFEKKSSNNTTVLLMSLAGIFMIAIFITQPLTLSFVLLIVCLITLLALGMGA